MCSCEGRNPGPNRSAISPWAPAFAGARLLGEETRTLNGGRHCCRPPLHHRLPVRCRTSSGWHGGLVRIASDPSIRRNKSSRQTSLLIPCSRSAGRPRQSRTGNTASGIRSIRFGRFTSLDSRLRALPPTRSQRQRQGAGQTVPHHWLMVGSTPAARCASMLLDHYKSLISQRFLVVLLKRECHDWRVAPRANRRCNAVRALKMVDGCG